MGLVNLRYADIFKFLYTKYSWDVAKTLDLAVTLGLLQKNVAKTVGNLKKVKKKVDFWTKEEFGKIIATFNMDDYYEHFFFITIWLLFMTGLRFGEAQALEWDTDIDLKEQTLTVSKSMYYKNATEFTITEPKKKLVIE